MDRAPQLLRNPGNGSSDPRDYLVTDQLEDFVRDVQDGYRPSSRVCEMRHRARIRSADRRARLRLSDTAERAGALHRRAAARTVAAAGVRRPCRSPRTCASRSRTFSSTCLPRRSRSWPTDPTALPRLSFRRDPGHAAAGCGRRHGRERGLAQRDPPEPRGLPKDRRYVVPRSTPCSLPERAAARELRASDPITEKGRSHTPALSDC